MGSEPNTYSIRTSGIHRVCGPFKVEFEFGGNFSIIFEER